MSRLRVSLLCLLALVACSCSDPAKGRVSRKFKNIFTDFRYLSDGRIKCTVDTIYWLYVRADVKSNPDACFEVDSAAFESAVAGEIWRSKR